MKLRVWDSRLGGFTIYELRFTDADLEAAKLTRGDRKILAALSSDDTPISDKLDGLTRIARLVESAAGPYAAKEEQ